MNTPASSPPSVCTAAPVHVAVLLHCKNNSQQRCGSSLSGDAIFGLWQAACKFGIEYLSLYGLSSGDNGVTHAIGRISREATTACITRLNIFPSGTGRDEIVKAARALISDVKEGRIDSGQIKAESLGRRLGTAHLPDPDLIIITGGMKRLNDTLLWQGAYSEFIFLDKCAQIITAEQLADSICEYQTRERRFGGLNKRTLALTNN